MKASTRFISRFVLVVVILCSLGTMSIAEQPAKYRDDTILVKPKKGVAVAQVQAVHKQLGAKTTHTFRAFGNLQVVKLPKGLTVEQAIEHYRKSGRVEYAEPDYEVHAIDCNPPGNPPNDPFFLNGTLWAMHNYGQSAGTCNADIDAPEGWQLATSADPVIVAIIDTGIRYTHEDLAANMWTNPCVSCPVNGVVYTNDVYGINAITDTGDPWDDYFHGTHVAGTIGGIGNNGTGVVGVAWNVRLMALKFLNQFGSGWTSDAIKCVDYARAKGAKVMSNSWGGGGFSQGLYDAIVAARDAGIIFVAAAGNNNRSNDEVPFYPASYNVENIVVVAATDRNDQRAWFSNWGTNTVHLGSPGVDIYSSYNTSDSAYAYLSGTSMATPHVSGVCAMLFAQYPTLSYSNIIERLLRSVDYIDSMQTRTITGGRLNFGRAIRDPIADFTASISPTQALTVVFADRSMASGGAITQRLLEFGDGYSSADPNVSYIYPSPGTFTAKLTVQNGSGSISTKTRKLVIPPVISNLSVAPGIGLLGPSGHYGGPFAPASRTFTLQNMGSDVLNWTAATPPNQGDWVSLSATNGALTPGGSATVDITFNEVTAQLFPGIYDTSVLFSNLTGLGSTARAVHLQVKEPPGTFTITPAEDFYAEGPEAGPFTPATKVYTLHNNSASFTFDWSTGLSQSWPIISPTNGTLGAGQSIDVTLTIDPANPNIAIGTNNATVQFSNDTTQEALQRNATIVANQVFFVTPDEMFLSEGSEGGPFTPTSKTYTLLYAGEGTFNWIAVPIFWIWQVSPASGTLTNGQSVDVTVSLSNAVNTLYSETWDGVVRFYNADTGHLHQERVTQLLVFNGTGQLYVNPSETFTSVGPRGGPFNPASKTYQVSWNGFTPVQWEVAPGATWMTVSPPSGTLNDGESVQVTVSLNSEANFLPGGTNTSSLVFRSASNIIYQTLPVSVIATQAPAGEMTLTPNEHFYGSGPVGGPFSPTNKVYTLHYVGPAPLYWSSFPNSDWFAATPESGMLTNGQSVEITVYLTDWANSLWDDLYEEDLLFFDANSDNYIDLKMVLDVGSAGVLNVSPGTGLTSAGPQGGPFNPASVTYTLQNTGAHWISWTATKLSTWITLSNTIGSIPPGASSNVTVSLNVNANALTAGDYSDTVNFKNTVNGNGTTTRAVALSVGTSAGVLSVTPSGGLSSSGVQGGPFSPSSQSYTLQNTGGVTINWTASKGAAWVTLSASGGSLTPGGSITVDVSINANANSLGGGSYSDVVNFSNTSNGNGNTTRSVALLVNAPANLSVTPSYGLTSSGTQGGPFNPLSQTYTLQNTGSVAMNWTASRTTAWTSLSATSGTLAPGVSTNISLSINSNANSLSAGSYSDTVGFVNTINGIGNTTRLVLLTVNAPANLSVTPAGGLSSSGTQGGPFSPSSQTYTLQNTGSVTMSWTVSKTAAWTTLSATSGALTPGGSTNVIVSINSNANSLSAGSYSDTVSFVNAINGLGNTTRSVSLTVNPPLGVLSVTPAGGLSSSGYQGGPFSPTNQTYTLQNAGGTTINWTASKSAAWTTLSAASGSLTPGGSTPVTVSINSGANSLAAGNYSDTVSFSNTSNGNGNTTRPVALTVNAVILNAPTSLVATQLTSSSVRLNWNDTSTNEAGSAIERAQKNGSSWSSYSQIATVGSNVTTYTNTGLSKRGYRYRVRSYRGTTYSPYSNVAEITVK
jgi:subtilisin family serine protease